MESELHYAERNRLAKIYARLDGEGSEVLNAFRERWGLHERDRSVHGAGLSN